MLTEQGRVVTDWCRVVVDAAGELWDGHLVEVPLTDVDLGRFLHAVWRRGSRLHTAARDFLGVIGPRTPAQSGRR